MKGLFSGMKNFPCIVAMRKRRRGMNLVPRKKPCKSQGQVTKEEVPIAINGDGQIAGHCMEIAAGDLRDVHQSERPISYDGDKVTVKLRLKQVIAMDGWAMVRLVEGRAAVDGYSLSPGMDVLLCSNSKFSNVVTIESQPPSLAVGSVIQERCQGQLTSCQASGTSDMPEQSANGGDAFGCMLEFCSYRGCTAQCGPSVIASKPESSRTFRLEVTGENEPYIQHDIQKIKRDECRAGEDSQVSLNNEEEMSDSGEDEEVGEMKAGDQFSDGQMDMEVDELSNFNNLISPERKKPRNNVHTPLPTTVIPDSWWAAASSILQPYKVIRPSEVSGSPEQDADMMQNYQVPVVVVCGAKNAGKSTFGRFLVNFLLNSNEAVGYLDTDVGQPEFTVPGCLSLHIVKKPIYGSPVLHLQTPERSFFYGDVSPKGDPEMYSRSVGALYDYFRQKYGSANSLAEDHKCGSSFIPLVINTHGWIKGIGYDVLVRILRHTSPTHVVQFTCKAENKNLPVGKFWDPSSGSDQTNILYIESAVEGFNRPLGRVKMASDHLRNSRIMAYFRQCFSRDPLPYPYREDKLYAQTALGLVNHPPYQVSISAVRIWHLHCHVPKVESLYSVDGALVGLGMMSTAVDSDQMPARGLPPLCVGLGIVRGIDAEKGILYVITPLPVDILQDVDTILQGRVGIPVALLQCIPLKPAGEGRVQDTCNWLNKSNVQSAPLIQDMRGILGQESAQIFTAEAGQYRTCPNMQLSVCKPIGRQSWEVYLWVLLTERKAKITNS